MHISMLHLQGDLCDLWYMNATVFILHMCKQALGAGIKRLVDSPMAFVKSRETALVYCLFAATYATANICKAVAAPVLPTLIATTIANMGTCFYKDSELARMCGQGPRREFPLKGFASLAARDTLSMMSAFSLPPVIAAVLKAGGMSMGAASNVAQMSCPVLAQTVQVFFFLLHVFFPPIRACWLVHVRRMVIIEMQKCMIRYPAMRICACMTCIHGGLWICVKLPAHAIHMPGIFLVQTLQRMPACMNPLVFYEPQSLFHVLQTYFGSAHNSPCI
jgi:hypothetical protein